MLFGSLARRLSDAALLAEKPQAIRADEASRDAENAEKKLSTGHFKPCQVEGIYWNTEGTSLDACIVIATI